MHKKFLVGLSFLAVLLVVAGCCKKKLYCQDAPMNIAITGYSRTESRSISIKRYKKGDHTKALDSGSMIYNKTLPALQTGQKDTLWLGDYSSSTYAFTGIKPGNDWAIYLPAVRENYLIYDMSDDGHRSDMVKCGDNSSSCDAQVAYFTVNQVYVEGNMLWIKKTIK